MLHLDQLDQGKDQPRASSAQPKIEPEVSANMATAKLEKYSLLMTCEVIIMAPDGSSSNVRALINSGSTASFISERLVQSLRLNRTNQKVYVTCRYRVCRQFQDMSHIWREKAYGNICTCSPSCRS